MLKSLALNEPVIYTDTEPRYRYTYGNSGEVAQVEDTALGTTIRREYDLANRPMRKTTLDANGEVYSAEVAYDQYNNLESFRERVGGENVYATGYEYDEENKPTKLTYSNGTEIRYEYDGLGRITKRTVTDGTDERETTYTYVPGANGNTTPLVQQISQPGGRMVYTYDETGNILSVEYPDIAGNNRISYAYDALGQLNRVNDPFDPTGMQGTTWVYTYDLGGNILSKTAYPFT